MCAVIERDEGYIYWCVNNVEDFQINEKVIEQIRLFYPDFIITDVFTRKISKNKVFEYSNYKKQQEYTCEEEEEEEEEENDDDDWFSECDTYERYNGSYAQDEMGYSDDDIDTIFDGDPSAYWNID